MPPETRNHPSDDRIVEERRSTLSLPLVPVRLVFYAGGGFRLPSAAAEPAALFLCPLRDYSVRSARVAHLNPLGRRGRVICSPRSDSGPPRCYAWSRAGHPRGDASGSGGGGSCSNAHIDARVDRLNPRGKKSNVQDSKARLLFEH
jgi:hypothetical protein